jgi:hypothetical protein
MIECNFQKDKITGVGGSSNTYSTAALFLCDVSRGLHGQSSCAVAACCSSVADPDAGLPLLLEKR